ncbi:MAG: hypothetical protein J6K71_02160, partial [Clostridia bacterium]|nr:hypothetical protein [Clostridia bacterium]
MLMVAIFLCPFVATVGIWLLHIKGTNATRAETAGGVDSYYGYISDYGNLNFYNDDYGYWTDPGNLYYYNQNQAPEPEEVEYVMTRTEVDDGVFNMSLVPISEAVITDNSEVFYANENGNFVMPEEPGELGGVNDDPSNPGILTVMHKIGDYQYQIRFGNWNTAKWDVTPMKVTTTVPPPETYTYSVTTGDPALGSDNTSGSKGSAHYGAYFSYTTSTKTTSDKRWVSHSVSGQLTVEQIKNMSQEERASLTKEDLAHLTREELITLGFWGNVGSAIGGAVSSAGNAIGGAISSAGNAIGSAIGGSVGSAISSAGNAIGGAISSAGNAIGGAISNAGNA